MVIIDSGLTDVTAAFGDVKPIFEQAGYELANIGYDHAYFDHTLSNTKDDAVYLRVPFFIEDGRMEADDAKIRFGQPFVIRHLYNTGLMDDLDAMNPLTNQFQKPIDSDAEQLEQRWVDQGKQALQRAASLIKGYVQA